MIRKCMGAYSGGAWSQRATNSADRITHGRAGITSQMHV